MKNAKLNLLISSLILLCSIATPAHATTFSGTYQLTPTAGAIDGSTITVEAELISAFPSVQDMMDEGFRTTGGDFAMQMFHFGSGWGFFDITPEPDNFVVIDNNGSTFGLNGWTIYSGNGQYSTIIAVWDTPPTQVTYGCDDFCIVATLSNPIGFEDEITDTDEDGLTDPEETLLGTDINNPDTDGDGFSDGEEAAAGTNPLDVNDSPFVDTDGDGVVEQDDLCPDTAEGALTDENGCSGLQNVTSACSCDGPETGGTWKNHGQYVSCVAHAKNAQVQAGLLTEEEGDALTEAAGESQCGKKAKGNKNK